MRSRVGPRQACTNALLINGWLTETSSGERLRFHGKKASFPWILALEIMSYEHKYLSMVYNGGDRSWIIPQNY